MSITPGYNYEQTPAAEIGSPPQRPAVQYALDRKPAARIYIDLAVPANSRRPRLWALQQSDPRFSEGALHQAITATSACARTRQGAIGHAGRCCHRRADPDRGAFAGQACEWPRRGRACGGPAANADACGWPPPASRRWQRAAELHSKMRTDEVWSSSTWSSFCKNATWKE